MAQGGCILECSGSAHFQACWTTSGFPQQVTLFEFGGYSAWAHTSMKDHAWYVAGGGGTLVRAEHTSHSVESMRSDKSFAQVPVGSA